MLHPDRYIRRFRHREGFLPVAFFQPFPAFPSGFLSGSLFPQHILISYTRSSTLAVYHGGKKTCDFSREMNCPPYFFLKQRISLLPFVTAPGLHGFSSVQALKLLRPDCLPSTLWDTLFQKRLVPTWFPVLTGDTLCIRLQGYHCIEFL